MTPARQLLDRRFLLFLVVGGVNTMFGYGCFVALIALGLVDWLAMAISTIMGVLFNFGTTGGVVFQNRDPRLLTRFAGGYALLYFVNLASLRILVAAGLHIYAASALLILPMAVVAYLVNKTWVFRRTE